MTQRGTARLLGEAIQAVGGDFDAGDSSMGVNWNGLNGMGEAMGVMRGAPERNNCMDRLEEEDGNSRAWRLLEILSSQ